MPDDGRLRPLSGPGGVIRTFSDWSDASGWMQSEHRYSKLLKISTQRERACFAKPGFTCSRCVLVHLGFQERRQLLR